MPHDEDMMTWLWSALTLGLACASMLVAAMVFSGETARTIAASDASLTQTGRPYEHAPVLSPVAPVSVPVVPPVAASVHHPPIPRVSKTSKPAAERNSRLHAPCAVPVLSFHDLCRRVEPGSVLTPVTAFERMLVTLKRQKYQTFFVSDIPSLLSGHCASLLPGHRPVVITFDDGYRNNYETLFPLLKRHRMKMTLFLIVGKIAEDRRTLGSLTWREVDEMVSSGLVEPGSHTFDLHCNLVQRIASARDKVSCWRGIYTDLLRARRTLERRLGVTVHGLAWPHGKRSPNLIKVARMAGYSLVFNTQFGSNVPGRCNRLDLCRVSASSPYLSAPALVRRLELASQGRRLDGRYGQVPFFEAD